MFCPHCGHEQVADETRFCSRCGLTLGLVTDLLGNKQNQVQREKRELWGIELISRNGMKRIGYLSIVFSVLFMIFGCSAAKRAARTPETEALLRAASAGNADTVRSLLASPNVDVNGIDDQGNTALMQAARFGHDEVVRALLIAKADVKIRNNEHKTALMLAAEAGHDQTVAVLTQAGAGK